MRKHGSICYHCYHKCRALKHACRMERIRQTPDTNCSITNQLLADWSRGRASCAQSRPSTRLQAAEDCGSRKTAWQTCQPPWKWDWRWPSLCRLDLERTGSVGEPLTDCAQGWAVQKQWWGDGAISMTPSRWIATARSHRRWPSQGWRVPHPLLTLDITPAIPC